MICGENWRPVRGYKGLYEVSDLGRVRSIDRKVYDKNGGTKKLSGKVLSQVLNKRNGYYRVCLYRDGKKSFVLVHLAVLKAFRGLPAPLEVGDHLNADKSNNTIKNLEWVTPRENDRRATVKLMKRKKLDPYSVRRIRIRYSKGESAYGLAKEYGIGPSTVHRILRGELWGWLS